MEKLHYQGDWDYAGTRLRDTVVRYEGEPVYVFSVSEENTAKIQVMGKGSQPYQWVPLDCLDLSPVPLGYTNTPSECSYTSRMPTRHYKQGLNGVNLDTGNAGSSVSFTSPCLYKTVMNNYPKIVDCFESIVVGESISRAFSRNFALTLGALSGLSLLFRGKEVGEITWNHEAQQPNYTLNNRYSYLQEMLEEELNV